MSERERGKGASVASTSLETLPTQHIAGQVLDALVAAKVFGWFWPKDHCPVCGWHFSDDEDGNGCRPDNCSMRPAPKRRADTVLPYSSDITLAWRVVEKMWELGYHARVKSPFFAGERYFAGFTPLGMTGWNGRPDFEAGADTAPHAICLAALKACDELRGAERDTP